MYYVPVLANGKPVPLSWPLRLYRFWNGIAWPLEDDPSFWARLIDRIYYVVGFSIMLFHHDGETRYLRASTDNLDNFLIGMPTYIILVEWHSRNFELGLNKEKLKAILKTFYANIYIEERLQPAVFKEIASKLSLTRYLTILYYVALGSFLVAPILNYINNTREPIYKMIIPFDLTPAYLYYPVILCNIWAGFIIITGLTGETTLLSEIILHVTSRLINLGGELQEASSKILERNDSANMAYDMQTHLKAALLKHQKLNDFLAELQKHISFRIFIWVSCSSMQLCSLIFKVYANPRESIGFAVWCFAKLTEMMALGEMGSILYMTTDRIYNVYYHCNWEDIVAASSNVKENIELMKLVVISMETSIKPTRIRGLNFFEVSLDTVIKVLRAAFSYFTFLRSFR